MLPTGTGGCGIIDAIREKKKRVQQTRERGQLITKRRRPTWWDISQVRDAIVYLTLFSKNKLRILRVYENGLERLSLTGRR